MEAQCCVAMVNCSLPPPNTIPFTPPTSLTHTLYVEYYIHHTIRSSISMMMMTNDDVMAQNMTCLVGTPVRSNRCTASRRSSILGAGSWRPFWFDHIIFLSMIFGRVMAKIRHGGGSRTVEFQPFSEIVRCGGNKRVKSY